MTVRDSSDTILDKTALTGRTSAWTDPDPIRVVNETVYEALPTDGEQDFESTSRRILFHAGQRVRPIYKKRCEKDDLEMKKYWLGPDDLIPDPGGPIEIEQPAKIVTKPLDMKNEDDRIRAVFELTSDDPLPAVDFETLEVYREYLAEHLAFPFEAVWESEAGPLSNRREKVRVTGLGDPDEDYRIDDMYGLICEIKIDKQRGDAPLAQMEAKKGDRNRQLLSDYCFWFWNYR